MQATKHNYEPVGCHNTAFESSFNGRDTTARRNLTDLFHKAKTEVAEKPACNFTSVGEAMEENDEHFEEISLDHENKAITDHNEKLSGSKASLNNLQEMADFLDYPVEVKTVITGKVLSTSDLTVTPIRNPSFINAISSSDTGIDMKKHSLRGPSVSSTAISTKSDHAHRPKSSSPSSVTSLPGTPRAPNFTSTPGRDPNAPNAQLSASILSENGICRICHEGDSHEDLVAPCYCAGSVGVLHLTCLERWLGTSNTTRCEICKYQFKVERQARSFWQFLKQPSENNDRKNMMCDIVCFVILTPLTAISAFLCMMGVKHYAQWDGRWEVPGLAILTSCLLVIYTVWCFVAMRHHYRVCKEWQNHNQIIKIKYLSPTKGKAILQTKKCTDKNNSSFSPARQTLLSPSPSTPSSSTHAPSYNRSLLRPILRYSSNMHSFSSPHDHLASFAQNLTWVENENARNSSERNNFITCCLSDDLARMARETYV